MSEDMRPEKIYADQSKADADHDNRRLDRPCSPCGDGDKEMKYHSHDRVAERSACPFKIGDRVRHKKSITSGFPEATVTEITEWGFKYEYAEPFLLSPRMGTISGGETYQAAFQLWELVPPAQQEAIPPQPPPATELSDGSLVQTLIEVYARTFMYPNSEPLHSRWLECQTEVLARLSRRSAPSERDAMPMMTCPVCEGCGEVQTDDPSVAYLRSRRPAPDGRDAELVCSFCKERDAALAEVAREFDKLVAEADATINRHIPPATPDFPPPDSPARLIVEENTTRRMCYHYSASVVRAFIVKPESSSRVGVVAEGPKRYDCADCFKELVYSATGVPTYSCEECQKLWSASTVANFAVIHAEIKNRDNPTSAIADANERIRSAAVRKAGIVYPCWAHSYDEIKRMNLDVPDDVLKGEDSEQGFVTSQGRFVDRVEGLAIATAANQIIEKHSPDDELMSEDTRATADKGAGGCHESTNDSSQATHGNPTLTPEGADRARE